MRVDIMIDMDGCLYPFADAMEQYLSDLLGPAPHPMDGAYQLYRHWDMSVDEWVQHYRRAIKEEKIFLSHAPHDGGLQALQAISDMGHRIIIVTARDLPGIEILCEQQTIEWLDKHNAIYDELHILSDKSKVKVDIAIDDTVTNLESLRDAHAARGILFTRPWNIQVSWTPRITSWEQAPALVDNLAYMLQHHSKI